MLQYFLNQIKYNSLINSFILLDSGISAIYFNLFTLQYKFLKYDKINVVNQYYNIYPLPFIERYTLYFILHLITQSIKYIIKHSSKNILTKYFTKYYIFSNTLELLPFNFISTINMITLLFGIPYIQHKIILKYNNYLDLYITNKLVFIKYSISKIFINIVQNLHVQIEKIHNYNIFILYNILNIQYIITISKHCLCISLLKLLKQSSSTYYYYKGIKMAYYYNTGYLYNTIPLANAIYLVNIIIIEKRWNELQNIEVVNAFIELFINKYITLTNIDTNLFTNLDYIIFQIIACLSLYSIISIFKIIHIINFSIFNFLILLLTLLSLVFYKLNLKYIITFISIYSLIIFNIHDLIITIIILSHNLFYYFTCELLFFIKNITNIKKICLLYQKNPKEDYIIVRN